MRRQQPPPRQSSDVAPSIVVFSSAVLKWAAFATLIAVLLVALPLPVPGAAPAINSRLSLLHACAG